MIEAIAEFCKTYTRRFVSVAGKTISIRNVSAFQVTVPSFGVPGERRIISSYNITLGDDRLVFTRYDKLDESVPERVIYYYSWVGDAFVVMLIEVVRLSDPDMFDKLKYFVQHGNMTQFGEVEER